jgi:hypothetical protein
VPDGGSPGCSERPARLGWAGSETPCFIGRGIAALAADPEVREKAGGLFGSWTLSDEYGFSDVDGAHPLWWKYGSEHFPQMLNAKSPTPYAWEVSAVKPASAALA